MPIPLPWEQQISSIVFLHGTSKDTESLYFVFEPLLGGPLHKHIRAGGGGRLKETIARFYAAEIVSALAHMHALHLAHRDLKANNVVLSETGHAKVIDLGCAKQLIPRGGGERVVDVARDNNSDEVFDCPPNVEKSYTYCGTPHCMAPEMVARSGHAFGVDWWALGILIHEMLTGTPPFGYGGEGLPDKILAGLSKPRRDSRTSPKASLEAHRVGRGNDTGGSCVGDHDDVSDSAQDTGCEAEIGRGTGESDRSDSDEGSTTVLPLVRRVEGRLLETHPGERLGSTSGAQEVMSHGWFGAVDWPKIAQAEIEPPPFRKDLGAMDFALDEDETGVEGVDPDGLFDNF